MKSTLLCRRPLTFFLLLSLATATFSGTASLVAQTQAPAAPAPATTVSKSELRRHVTKLASDEFKGRDATGEGGLIAAKYLANEFKKFGLRPGGNKGHYFQKFNGAQMQERFYSNREPRNRQPSTSTDPSIATVSNHVDKAEDVDPAPPCDNLASPCDNQEIQKAAQKTCDWLERAFGSGPRYRCRDFECRNVLAFLPGSDPKLKDEVIIVSAHYDHLGVRGGKVYNGADDNASGTATVLELARTFQNRKDKPRRSILFAAWDGEEKGLCGSTFWTENPTIPLEKVVAVINLDMIGRMRDDKLIVLGTGSSDQLFRLVSTHAQGAKIKLLNWETGCCSDHWPFCAKRVPSITLCSGVHKDYHSPTDDVELIHFTNLERIALMTLGLVDDLANREKRVEPSPAGKRR